MLANQKVNKNSQYIGLDLGTARTGFARGASIAGIAEPLLTIPTDQALDKLISMLEDQQIDGVVVGLPRNLNGDDTAQTSWVRQWVADAKEKIAVPIYFQDEALTSKIAESKIQSSQKFDVDSLAASIILQDFLNSTDAERTVS